MKFKIIIYAGFILTVMLFFIMLNKIRTYASIKKIDEYPAYEMTWYGNYNLDHHLNYKFNNEEDYYKKSFRKQIRQFGCTCFTATDANGKFIHARNFDEEYSPLIILKTKPQKGYASISAVSKKILGDFPGSIFMAPLMPLDGMNEKGLSISVIFLPDYDGKPPYAEGKNFLQNNLLIRMCLDKAAGVDEAIKLIKQYNIMNPNFHFMIADRSGKSVVVEFYDGEFKIINAEKGRQVASSFPLCRPPKGKGLLRFGTVWKAINEKKLSKNEMLELMSKVSMKGQFYLQWTGLYNMDNLTVDYTLNGKTDRTYHYSVSE